MAQLESAGYVEVTGRPFESGRAYRDARLAGAGGGPQNRRDPVRLRGASRGPWSNGKDGGPLNRKCAFDSRRCQDPWCSRCGRSWLDGHKGNKIIYLNGRSACTQDREVLHNFNADGFDSLYPRYEGGRAPRRGTTASALTGAAKAGPYVHRRSECRDSLGSVAGARDPVEQVTCCGGPSFTKPRQHGIDNLANVCSAAHCVSPQIHASLMVDPPGRADFRWPYRSRAGRLPGCKKAHGSFRRLSDKGPP